jgi:hypothetical protein
LQHVGNVEFLTALRLVEDLGTPAAKKKEALAR